MHGRHSLTTLITALVLIPLVTGCGQAQSSQSSSLNDPWGVVAIGSGKTVRIGVALSNTNSASENAEAARGIDLAVRHFRDVDGFPLEIATVVAECTEAGGQAAATDLVSDPTIVAVIGPDCSTACQSAMPILEEAHYTAISPGCMASRLSDPVQHVGAFIRTVSSDTLEGYLAAQFAYRELGARRIAVIDDGSPDTLDALAAFETRMTNLGGKIIARATIVSGESDMGPALATITTENVDLIYAPIASGDAATLIAHRQADAGLASIALIGGRHYWDNRLIDAIGQPTEGIYATGPYITTALFDEANSSYKALYRQAPPSPAYAFAYDAVSILVEALAKVALTDSQGTLVIGRQALQDEIYSTANLPGLTGYLTCTTWGDCAGEGLAVAQLQSGKWVAIYVP